MKPGDLDDPTPVEPDDSLLERVHARSGAFRRRRRAQRLTGVGAAALVVVLAVVVAIAVPVGDNDAEPDRPAATTTTSTPTRTTASDLEGTWKPVSVAGYSGPFARPPFNAAADLRFRATEWSGRDGCNSLSGTYRVAEDGTFQAGKDHFSTLVGCSNSLPLAAVLSATTRVAVLDGELTLFDNDRKLATFTQTGVTARIELPSDTIAAGTFLRGGRLVVDNQTGREIKASGCLSLFQVALRNATYQPGLAWPTCLQDLDVPTGVSTYPITVSARTVAGDALPAGTYEAALFQSTHVVPDPEPVPVTVVARDQAPPEFSADDLRQALVDAGYEMTDNGSSQGSFGARRIERWCASGTRVSVYEYADEAARREFSDGISADGSMFSQGSARTQVDWMGPPHFYARGRILALVLQDDTRLLQTLGEIMGPTISPEASSTPRLKSACY